jgi:hypothetical protein
MMRHCQHPPLTEGCFRHGYIVILVTFNHAWPAIKGVKTFQARAAGRKIATGNG